MPFEAVSAQVTESDEGDARGFSVGELVRLSAEDPTLFNKAFFPRATRQSAPPKHQEITAAFDDPRKRFINLRAFRGSGKTTLFRLFMARRVAFGISKTVLLLGSNDSKAAQSVTWLRNNVERNALFRDTFRLKPGRKWSENEIEIISEVDGHSAWALGAGITGGAIRGINFDDFRPDLIFLDDVINDETAATDVQREKAEGLVLGAVRHSLAPAVDEPNAKMILAQTPIASEDLADQARKDSQFHTIEFSCWTPETQDLPVQFQVSSWPERFPTEELRNEKVAAAQRNRLSVFAREMEVRLVTAETASFRSNWLRFYDELPAGLWNVVSVDPVPPPTEQQLQKQLHNKSFEAITVWGRRAGNYYLVDYKLQRGHEPNWTVTTILELANRYSAKKIIIETIAYQRTLKYLVQTTMRKNGVYFMIQDFQDKSSKFHRIVDAFSGPASEGHVLVSAAHTEFIEQFEHYPGVAHPDLLDASSMALKDLVVPTLDLGADDYNVIEDLMPDLPQLRRAP